MTRRNRLVLTGPHKGRIEFDQATREIQDAQGFGKGDKLKPNGNAKFQKFVNSTSGGSSGQSSTHGEGGGGGNISNE